MEEIIKASPKLPPAAPVPVTVPAFTPTPFFTFDFLFEPDPCSNPNSMDYRRYGCGVH